MRSAISLPTILRPQKYFFRPQSSSAIRSSMMLTVQEFKLTVARQQEMRGFTRGSHRAELSPMIKSHVLLNVVETPRGEILGMLRP